VARASDLGRNDITFNTVTHLGNILQHGDSVAGYDLSTINVNSEEMEALRGKTVRSEIILVKKVCLGENENEDEEEKRNRLSIANKRDSCIRTDERGQEEDTGP
jgi:nonsense-mediated mRNA decay protein 3